MNTVAGNGLIYWLVDGGTVAAGPFSDTPELTGKQRALDERDRLERARRGRHIIVTSGEDYAQVVRDAQCGRIRDDRTRRRLSL